MKIKKNIWMIVSIFLVVVVLGLIAYPLYNQFKYIPSETFTVNQDNIKKEQTSNKEFCQDKQDNGNNIFVKGTTSTNSLTKIDLCLDEKTLKEYYCEDEKIIGIVSSCPQNYICKSGACEFKTNYLKEDECQDSDGGKNYFTLGAVFYNNNHYEDICLSNKEVKEYFCENKKMLTVNYSCNQNEECIHGYCQNIVISCYDSDGGEDIFNKGEVEFNSQTIGDTCASPSMVDEAHCFEDKLKINSVACPTNYYCNKGECVQNQTISNQTNYICNDSDNGKDYGTQGMVNLTDAQTLISTSMDFCANTSTLNEYYCNNNQIKSENYVCPTGEWCQNGACELEPLCNDSDGQDTTQKTTATKGSSSKYDYCQWNDEHIINEAICDSNKLTYKSIVCSIGKWCQNGACVPEPSCTETDNGRDYSTQGTTTKGNQSSSDYCQINKYLTEYYCTPAGLFKSEVIICANSCQGGNCI